MVRTLIAAAVVLFGASTATAEDSGRIGITMGYPASVGLMWRLSDRVALRPEVSLTQISSSSTSVLTITGSGGTVSSTTTQSSNDQWTVGVGASALVYVTHAEALRTYLSPRFVYARGSSSSTISAPINAAVPTVEFTSNTYFASGSFGAEYTLGTHFALYGELGLGYQHTTSESTANGAGNTKSNTVGTRSGAGVILYF